MTAATPSAPSAPSAPTNSVSQHKGENDESGTTERWHEGRSKNRRETAKRDSQGWRRACVVAACRPPIPPLACPFSFFHAHRRGARRERRGGSVCEYSQLSGAVGGRASSALISIVKASLRAVFRGGSFVDGCGTAAQTQCCGDASGCCGEWCAARCDGEELVSSHAKGLCSVET